VRLAWGSLSGARVGSTSLASARLCHASTLCGSAAVLHPACSTTRPAAASLLHAPRHVPCCAARHLEQLQQASEALTNKPLWKVAMQAMRLICSPLAIEPAQQPRAKVLHEQAVAMLEESCKEMKDKKKKRKQRAAREAANASAKDELVRSAEFQVG
jgi:hypothetical protein